MDTRFICSGRMDTATRNPPHSPLDWTSGKPRGKETNLEEREWASTRAAVSRRAATFSLQGVRRGYHVRPRLNMIVCLGPRTNHAITHTWCLFGGCGQEDQQPDHSQLHRQQQQMITCSPRSHGCRAHPWAFRNAQLRAASHCTMATYEAGVGNGHEFCGAPQCRGLAFFLRTNITVSCIYHSSLNPMYVPRREGGRKVERHIDRSKDTEREKTKYDAHNPTQPLETLPQIE